MMFRKAYWTEATVTQEILRCFRHGMDLSYTNMRKEYMALVRAAERAFGSWSLAIDTAGLDYQTIRRYKIWNRERILQQIQRWHAASEDLHWHYVQTVLDPALAAAVQHSHDFAHWSDALHQAGLDPDTIYRYRKWTPERVKEAFLAYGMHGIPLTQDAIARVDPALLAAIYRVTGGLTQLRALLAGSTEETIRPAHTVIETAVDTLFTRITEELTDLLDSTMVSTAGKTLVSTGSVSGAQ